jgi:hypothetical protein
LAGCQFIWNYFASGHGKGEVDGAGALLKRELRKEQMKPDGMQIHNSLEAVTYLRAQAAKLHAAHPNARRTTHKYFWEVKKDDVKRDNAFDCQTVKGSRRAHQVRSVCPRDPTLIEYRDSSCFCLSCLDSTLQFPCENAVHVQPWTLARLSPIDRATAREVLEDAEEEIEYGAGGEDMADAVVVGDNIAIKCESSSDDENFWILIVDKPLHMVQTTFKDGWEQEWMPGDYVVSGKY